MQVFCRSTSGNAECHCSVCGQGIVIFWERQSRAERLEALREIQRELRNHHRYGSGVAAHPRDGFLYPAWNGHGLHSSTAIPARAPTLQR